MCGAIRNRWRPSPYASTGLSTGRTRFAGSLYAARQDDDAVQAFIQASGQRGGRGAGRTQALGAAWIDAPRSCLSADRVYDGAAFHAAARPWAVLPAQIRRTNPQPRAGPRRTPMRTARGYSLWPIRVAWPRFSVPGDGLDLAEVTTPHDLTAGAQEVQSTSTLPRSWCRARAVMRCPSGLCWA